MSLPTPGFRNAKAQHLMRHSMVLGRPEYDKDAEAAARFYAKTFPDSAVDAVHRAPAITHPARKATC